jgi:hypothetical protein
MQEISGNEGNKFSLKKLDEGEENNFHRKSTSSF